MRRIGGVVVVGVLALAGAGCGDDGGRASTSAGPPPEVDAVWAATGEVVDAAGPDPLLLPGPGLPEGAVLTELVPPDPEADAELPSIAEALDEVHHAAQTLYADPDAPDPATGRSLTVGRSRESDGDTGLALPQDAEPVALPVGDEGRIARVGDAWLVAWDLPLEHDCGCTQEGFVLARGTGRAEALAAAREADVLGPRPSVPAAHVEGLRPLGTTSGVGLQVPATGPQAQSLTVELPAGPVHVSVRTGDVRLPVHARVWPAEGRHRSIERRDDGTVVTASAAPPVTAAEVEAVTAALVPASAAEVRAALDRIDAEVPLEDCAAEWPVGPPERSASFGGRTPSGGRWVLGGGYDGRLLQTCDRIAAPGRRGQGGGGGGGHHDLDLDAPVAVLPGTTASGDGQVHRFVVGHVASGAAEVVVEVGGAAPVAAQLAATGPADGRRWFAAVLDVTAFGLGGPGPIEVVVRAADGTELARLPLP